MRSTKLWSLGTAVLAAVAMTIPAAQTAGAAKDADFAQIVTNTVNVTVCWKGFKCGGGNTYSFTSNSCTGASVSSLADIEAPGGCSATSSGTFSNIVCGTGIISGANATLTETGGDGGTYDTNGLSIIFVGGLGVLDSTTMNDPADGQSNMQTAGIVQITPNSLQPPTSTSAVCTNGFIVTTVLASDA